MRAFTLLFLAATLLAFKPTAPVPQAGINAVPEGLAEFNFRRMHLMRPDLVGYPSAKIGKVC